MRKQFTKDNKPLYASDKDNRASKIAYRKVKNKYFSKDCGRYDWETEAESSYGKINPANSADIS